MKKAILIAALLTTPLFAGAQTPAVPASDTAGASTAVTLKEALSGSTHPLTLKLRDMKAEEWRRFTLAGQTDNSMESYFSLLFGAMGGGGALPSAEAVYYTQAQTVAISAETYLVAYRPLLKQPDITALMMQGNGALPVPEQIIPEKLALDSLVSLSLLNVKKISGMTNVRPFDAAQEVAERQAADKALLDMIHANAAQNNPAIDAPLQPVVAPKVRALISADKTLKADGNIIAVEENGNQITLRGTVTSAKVKDYADHLVRKYFKDNGLGFTLDNELTTPDAAESKAAPGAAVKSAPKQKKSGAGAAKKKS